MQEVSDRRAPGTRALLVDILCGVSPLEDACRARRVHMLCHLDSAARSPQHPCFITAVLEPLADRQMAGEPGGELSMELYDIVHPWAVSFASTQSCSLPAHADRNEVLSQVLRLTWEACLRIDWTRYPAWPTFLENKVSRARIEAARCDDWVSRRERMRRTAYQGELARREQVEQRSLTDVERHAVARAVAPASTRVEWVQAMLNSRHPSTVADVPDTIQMTTDGCGTVEDQVELREIGGIRGRCLAEWLSIVAGQNHRLAADLSRWSELDESANRDLPVRLAHRVEPYTSLLLAMLGDAA